VEERIFPYLKIFSPAFDKSRLCFAKPLMYQGTFTKEAYRLKALSLPFEALCEEGIWVGLCGHNLKLFPEMPAQYMLRG